MHELGITRNIVSIVAEHADGRAVSRVRLEIGQLSGVLSGAVRFCFDVAVKGTLLEGAVLEIVEPAGRGRCRACGAEFDQETLFSPCRCGARDFDRLSGEELKIVEFEVETGAEEAVTAASPAA